jgi:UDP-2,3-diacylglucosamine pyrophosphatase LpxH
MPFLARTPFAGKPDPRHTLRRFARHAKNLRRGDKDTVARYYEGCARRLLLTHGKRVRNVRDVQERVAATATHCRAGHEWTPETTYTYEVLQLCGVRTYRTCRVCHAAKARERWAKRVGPLTVPA